MKEGPGADYRESSGGGVTISFLCSLPLSLLNTGVRPVRAAQTVQAARAV